MTQHRGVQRHFLLLTAIPNAIAIRFICSPVLATALDTTPHHMMGYWAGFPDEILVNPQPSTSSSRSPPYDRDMREQSNERTRTQRGTFSPSDTPKKRQLCVSLSEPFIAALDAHGKKNVDWAWWIHRNAPTGRSGRLSTTQRSTPSTEGSGGSDPDQEIQPFYVKYREDHYIEDRGTVGQQIQYLITYGGRDVGVIGGASAVFANEPRDDYFSLSTIKDEKTVQLNSIINNNIFKLDFPAPGLATLVLAKWRRTIAQHWEYIYGVKVSGFETFVVEERLWDGRKRDVKLLQSR